MVKISVIVPAYKRVEQTVKTLDLILASRLENIELEIILADSTPDESLKMAIESKFGDKVIYTRPDKEGISTNKNQGARIAKGEILIFCDSDMEIELDTLAKTVDYLKNNKYAAAIGTQVIWRDGDKDGEADRPRPEDRLFDFQGFSAVEAIYSRYIATYKDIFWNVGGYDEIVFNKRGEGSDLSLRYWRAGYPLFYNSEIKVFHVHGAPDSIALRISHPQWGVAKDLLLLAYKYDMLDGEHPNFKNTIKVNFSSLGDNSYSEIITGIGKNLDFIVSIKPEIDKEKENLSPGYDFKFLEVFSDTQLLNDCLNSAEARLKPVREKIF